MEDQETSAPSAREKFYDTEIACLKQLGVPLQPGEAA